jgi:hypothetical protein
LWRNHEKKDKRTKQIVCLLGDSSITRNYYECEKCCSHLIPKDKLLGIENTSFTPGVVYATSKLSGCDSFRSSSEGLKELCGINVTSKEAERLSESTGEKIEALNQQKIEEAFNCNEKPTQRNTVPIMYIEFDGTGVPMIKKELEGRQGKQEDGTSKTREAKLGCIFTQTKADEKGNPVRDSDSTTYFGAIEPAAQFGKRLYGEATHRDVNSAEKVVIIGDGAKWIWNLAAEHFPDAVCIIDLYHAKEHVYNLIKQLVPDENLRYHYKKKWFALLEKGDIDSLVVEFSSFIEKNKGQEDFINKEIGYFTENSERMKYADFKAQNLFVGSGVIEAGCKNVIGKRLKQSGMRWSLSGANAMIALRCAILSGSFRQTFESTIAA